MSAKELSRLEVMQRLSRKAISQRKAGRVLNLSVRQIKRLLRAYRQQGAVGLVSKHRGRKANNCLPAEVTQRALNLLKTKYQGFGLTFESVRKLMIEENLWQPGKAKKVVVHQLRAAIFTCYRSERDFLSTQRAFFL